MPLFKKHRQETTTNDPGSKPQPALVPHSYAQDPRLMQENNNDSQSTDPSSLPGDPSVTGVRFGANPHYPSWSDDKRFSLKKDTSGRHMSNFPPPIPDRTVSDTWSTQASAGDLTDPNRSDPTNRQGRSDNPPTNTMLKDSTGGGEGNMNSQELNDLAEKRAKESAASEKQGAELRGLRRRP